MAEEHRATTGRTLEKAALPQQLGCALVVVALVLLTIVTTAPELFSMTVAVYSYVLLGVGCVLAAVNLVLNHLLLRRVGAQKVYCWSCGWSGLGAEWFKGECCPECDSERVTLVQ
jgi:hypothetical protein